MTIFIRLSPHRLSIRAQDNAPPVRDLAGAGAIGSARIAVDRTESTCGASKPAFRAPPVGRRSHRLRSRRWTILQRQMKCRPASAQERLRPSAAP
ncbi:MAG: hypothetical protein ACREP7_19310 [Lysobacter sp.]